MQPKVGRNQLPRSRFIFSFLEWFFWRGCEGVIGFCKTLGMMTKSVFIGNPKSVKLRVKILINRDKMMISIAKR